VSTHRSLPLQAPGGSLPYRFGQKAVAESSAGGSGAARAPGNTRIVRALYADSLGTACAWLEAAAEQDI
jgi:RES domain-containing protein